MLWIIVKMFLALGLMGVLLFFCLKFFKRVGLSGVNDPASGGVKVLTNKLIAPQRYITLVEIGDEIFALGISPQHISFLTKIDHKESLLRKISPLNTVNNSAKWFGLWKSPSLRQNLAWAREKNED
ncbi:MAG: FliO/MopB family protein [Thermodesulfobacteriota bacterium]